MKRRKPGAWPGGSSPRVRGTRGPQSHRGRHRRFIPACAGNTSNASSGVSNRSVHPRVCGEHEGLGQRAGAVDGSSPRVRGTRVGPAERVERSRFIPACAGNTRVNLTNFSSNVGSSPRVRGTPIIASPPTARRRFIPACAGNTQRGRISRARRTVHPRVCGEHLRDPFIFNETNGSSPRVRGTPYPVWASTSASTVHPRVCGEHGFAAPITRESGGSSPRVRGTPGGSGARALVPRFIPACAGNTRRRIISASLPVVHPRVCGEHSIRVPNAASNGGSSPRVRGTRRGAAHPGSGRRFIPACAGNTPPPATSTTHRAVHPRVCGEHRRGDVVHRHGRGSSPRVRGTQGPSQPSASIRRFIPACAGNTG